MRHRLVMVTGACPGAGKSSLSAALAAELGRRGAAVRLLTEFELLDSGPFGAFDRALGRDDPAAVEQLLEATRELAAAWPAAETPIVDAILPGFFWLLGRFPRRRVERFADDLAALLGSREPLVVYLGGDPGRLFARAANQGGFAAAVQRWGLPHYPGSPIRGTDGVLRFFDWLQDETCRLLETGCPAASLVLAADEAPVGELAGRVLREIGVD